MTKQQGYQNPSGLPEPPDVTPAEDSTRKKRPITSTDPEKPLLLDIRRGTPAVDMQHEIFGSVWGLTGSYCVIRTPARTFAIADWEDVALGHVRPVSAIPPDAEDLAERDRMDYYATALRELDAAWCVGKRRELPPKLWAAHQYLSDLLQAEGADRGE